MDTVLKMKWDRTFLVSLLLVIVLCSMLGEKVAINNGAGWDGVEYRDIARNFTERITTISYDKYRIQRILPFALINVTYSLLNISKDDRSLMNGALFLNLVSLITAIYFFFKISNYLRLKSIVEIISFSSLFYNFPSLKLLGYCPFLSDYYALCLGLACFYFFIKGKQISLVFCGILGSIIWPVALITALCLAFLPKDEVNLCSDIKIKTGVNVMQSCIKTIVAFSPLVFVLFLYYYKGGYEGLMGLYYDAKPLNGVMLLLSSLSIVYYLYRVVKHINIDVLKVLAFFWKKIKWSYILSFVLIYSCVNFIIIYFSNGEKGALDMKGLLVSNILFSTTDPFVFLINHFLYFGFAVLLLILLWRKLLPQYGKYGFGFLFVLFLIIFFSLRAESRVSIMFLPFLFFPLFELINKFEIKKWVAYTYCIASLILSRFWFQINTNGIEQAFLNPGEEGYISFPAQRYFMNFAHWQSHEIYLLFLIIGFTSSLLIYWGFRTNIFIEKK